MSTPSPQAEKCPHCGAPLHAAARFCWLCGVPAQPGQPGTRVWQADVVETNPFAPPAQYQRRALWQFQISSLLLVFVVAAVVLGAYVQEPVIGTVLGVLLIPPTIYTVAVTLVRKTRGLPTSPVQKAGAFARATVMTVSIAFGLAGLAIVAGVVALVAICTGGFH